MHGSHQFCHLIKGETDDSGREMIGRAAGCNVVSLRSDLLVRTDDPVCCLTVGSHSFQCGGRLDIEIGYQPVCKDPDAFPPSPRTYQVQSRI